MKLFIFIEKMYSEIITIFKSSLKQIVGLLLQSRNATYEYSYKKERRKWKKPKCMTLDMSTLRR